MITIGMENRNEIFTRSLSGFGLLILLITLIGCNEKKEEAKDAGETQAPVTAPESSGAVSEFVDFVEDDENKMDLDHAYTQEALNKLVEATRATAENIDYDVKADLDKVKEYADKIATDPFATTHADNIRKSADILAGVLQKMQQAKYPELDKDVEELKESCAAIKPGVLTLDQKDAVKSFFNESAEVLGKMN